jgi:hypothetical protein
MRIAARGGTPEDVTRLDPPRQIGHQSPTFLPDGRHFLFRRMAARQRQESISEHWMEAHPNG